MSNLQTNLTFQKSEPQSTKGMVATKDRLATQAGIDMLEAGGNAIDAAVASCLAIGVVEPESSGIGGGGYMVFQVGNEGGVIGFPMKGPLKGTPNMFELTGEASTEGFGWAGVKNDENIHGFKSIAVPGCLAGLYEAHKKFGKLPFKETITPAITLAKNGFQPEWFSLYKLASMLPMLNRYSELGKTFLPNGNLNFAHMTNGENKLIQSDLARTLIEIHDNGIDSFYRGDITKKIVKDIQENGGILNFDDFDQYKPFIWKGLEFKYRNKTLRVPPYASAGITSAMTLKILNNIDLKKFDHNSPEMLHHYICAAKMAYADRFQYLADPEFTDVPWNGLISDEYSKIRALEIKKTAPNNFEFGNPWIQEGREPNTFADPSTPSPDNGTTHLAVIDGDGNAVSITNTIMSGFGSGIIPKGTGVVMNNGMMWYDPVPGRVNSVAPGKYPLNNMTPCIVLGNDGVEIAVGASGGRRITNCVTSLLVKMIDYNLNPQEAIDAPRVDCSSDFTDLTSGIDQNTINELIQKGHKINKLSDELLRSGINMFASPVAITRKNNQLRAGVDSFHTAYAQGLT